MMGISTAANTQSPLVDRHVSRLGRKTHTTGQKTKYGNARKAKNPVVSLRGSPFQALYSEWLNPEG